MEWIIDYLRSAPIAELVLLFIVENLVIVLAAVGVGRWLVRRYEGRRVTASPPLIGRREVCWAGATIVFNSVVTVAGLLLWRVGVIRFREDVGLLAWLDIVALLLLMDVAMYALHRIAHHRFILPWMHQTHHDQTRPRPLDLFVLSPFEALGFGTLWLIVVSLYDASWLGMSTYLALNVAFGTLGHLGVEVFPRWWIRTPLMRWITTSTFHAQHHHDIACNFGFYTAVWDRMLGTIHPDYERVFLAAHTTEEQPAVLATMNAHPTAATRS